MPALSVVGTVYSTPRGSYCGTRGVVAEGPEPPVHKVGTYRGRVCRSERTGHGRLPHGVLKEEGAAAEPKAGAQKQGGSSH